MSADEPILVAEHVGRVFTRRGRSRHALTDVSLSLRSGETLAVVGESGAGKSTLSRLVAGLDRPTTGSILVAGRSPVPGGGRPSPVQLVFQNPRDALNPYISIGTSVGEPLRHASRAERRRVVAASLQRVGLDPARMGERPGSFSGGQQQRIVIARALAASPRVLVCDEPTSALDVSVQAQIVNLLLELQATLRFACLLVTHDLSVVRVLADRVLVLRDGEVVEASTCDAFFTRPAADYSRSLLAAVSQQALIRHDVDGQAPPDVGPPRLPSPVGQPVATTQEFQP